MTEKEKKEHKRIYNREYYHRNRDKILKQKQEHCVEYRQRPEVKERLRECARRRRQLPGAKESRREYVREYRNRPGVIERIMALARERENREDANSHRREYKRKYRQRPEVKERHAAEKRLRRQRMREADETTTLMQLKFKLQEMGYSAPPGENKGD